MASGRFLNYCLLSMNAHNGAKTYMIQSSNPQADGTPRRILALSGGGVRGIVEVAFLEAVEAAYKRKFGPSTALADVFDLVGGTSTGALIATAVSLRQPMDQIADFYLNRAQRFFRKKRWWRFGHAPFFNGDALETEFRRNVGDITLGDPRLQTYLAIITKRLDTGSAWIVNNIPTSPYFDDPQDGSYRGNKHFQLARLLRASTAAPFYFKQQMIELERDGLKGVFVDGGLTPYNDPSLALLQLAGIKAFGLNWTFDAQNLFVLSLGTGHARLQFRPEHAARFRPFRLLPLAVWGGMQDSEAHTRTMMEWMGTSPSPSWINSELQTLESDSLGDRPLFTYLRMDLPLNAGGETGLSPRDAKRFMSMDDPDIIRPLYDLAQDYVTDKWDLFKILV